MNPSPGETGQQPGAQHGLGRPHGGMCPVSTRPIPGTSWSEVRTNTGHVYYYCQKTGTSTWDIPHEVGERLSLERVGDQMGIHGHGKKRRSVPRVIDEQMMKAMKRAKANGAVLAPEYEEMLQMSDKGGSSSEKHGKKRKAPENAKQVVEFDVTFDEDDIAEEDVVRNAEQQKQAEQHAGKTVQEGEKRRGFFDMLNELGIHGFSRFEKEVGRMQEDARFLAVETMQKRKEYFEEYCKGQGPNMNKTVGRVKTLIKGSTVAVEEDHMKSRKDAFTALLQEKVLMSSLDWYDIVHVLEKDDRFREIESEVLRKDLFRNHQRRLGKAEVAKKTADRRLQRDLQAGKERQLSSGRRDARIHYKALLTEMVRDPLATWESEAKALESDPQGRASNSLLDERTAREMFECHVKDLYEFAKKNVQSVFEKNKIPPSSSFAEASAYLADELVEYPESLQMDAWASYAANIE